MRPVLFAFLAVFTLLVSDGSARAFTDVQPDRLDYAAITALTVKGAR